MSKTVGIAQHLSRIHGHYGRDLGRLEVAQNHAHEILVPIDMVRRHLARLQVRDEPRAKVPNLKAGEEIVGRAIGAHDDRVDEEFRPLERRLHDILVIKDRWESRGAAQTEDPLHCRSKT